MTARAARGCVCQTVSARTPSASASRSACVASLTAGCIGPACGFARRTCKRVADRAGEAASGRLRSAGRRSSVLAVAVVAPRAKPSARSCRRSRMTTRAMALRSTYQVHMAEVRRARCRGLRVAVRTAGRSTPPRYRQSARVARRATRGRPGSVPASRCRRPRTTRSPTSRAARARRACRPRRPKSRMRLR